MPCGNRLDLPHALRSDVASALREGFELALQSKSHAFEQTSMHDVGKRMPVQDSVKIRRESQSPSDLPQASEEHMGVTQLSAWRQVLGIARVANHCPRRDAAQP